MRRGSDIAKALALGAKAVLTGRATLYGTSVAGQAGAAKAISVIRKELDTTMVYVGAKTVEELTPDILFGPRVNSASRFRGVRAPIASPAAKPGLEGRRAIRCRRNFAVPAKAGDARTLSADADPIML